MNIYVIVRWLNPSDLTRLGGPKYEISLFSKKEYTDAYTRLYGNVGDQLYEVVLDEKVPEMKQLIDNLACNLQTAITVPCKTEL